MKCMDDILGIFVAYSSLFVLGAAKEMLSLVK